MRKQGQVYSRRCTSVEMTMGVALSARAKVRLNALSEVTKIRRSAGFYTCLDAHL